MRNVRFGKWMYAVPFAVLAITIQLHAQGTRPHHQYKLTQVATFGGPNSVNATGPNNNILNSLSIWGGTVGWASTDTPDPFSPNCFNWDCTVDRALQYQDGFLTDLGALPGTNSSVSYGINDLGLVVGVSGNGKMDPLTGYPEYHAVVWGEGGIKDLGTLGGSSSQAFAVNDWGQVVGVAANTVPDSYSGGIGPCTGWNCWTVTTQQRAFLWEGGKMQDLGTLGGNDAVAYFVNQAGQVAGVSYTNTTPNSTTGLPTQDPFLWENGKMIDLGTLGGTWGVVYGLNNSGQVVGYSNEAGDDGSYAFLWDRGVLTNLPSYGYGAGATSINEVGDVVGYSWIESGTDWTDHPILWSHGVMTDLGLPTGAWYAIPDAVNSSRQIVGYTSLDAAYLWENGEPGVDLNALVIPASNPSGLQLYWPYAIADSGEIIALGTLPNGDIRMGVLVPDGICGSDCEARIAARDRARAAAAQAGPGAGTAMGAAPASGKTAAQRPGPIGARRLTPPTPVAPRN